MSAPDTFDTLFDTAVQSRLASDNALTTLCATFQSQPCISVVDPVPKGFIMPYVVIAPPLIAVSFDTKDRQGFDIVRDITSWRAVNASARLVNTMARRVHNDLHRYRDLAISGYDVLIAEARGPVTAPADDTVMGRIVSVRWVLRARDPW